MIELLRRADAARPAIVTDAGTTTYGDLVARSEAFAGALLDGRVSRFAVVDPDAVTVVALLAGASLVGAEACQYPPADDPAEFAALAAHFGHATMVSPGCALPEGLRSIPPDALRGARDVRGRPPEARPLLVLTTGTTGAPRGVRHDWNRLLRATLRIAPAPDQRWLLAYGLHQFAGLQMLLHVFAAGATLVVPELRRPRAGLAAMRAHGVDHASATPTYWRFLLAELRADGGPVPQLEQITLGGEAVPAPVLAELARVFPDARLSQVYAASEFGATGSVRDGRTGLSMDVLSRGDDTDVALKIVDGELWVRSRVGMLGYYGEPPIDPDAWRPTCDLVEIAGDRILFRGRTGEVIKVGGVKVHPLPVEERVGAVPGVDIARVYGRPNPLTGAVVAVEVVSAPGSDQDALREAIRAACADLPAPSRPRSIRFVESVSTAGDKIARRLR